MDVFLRFFWIYTVMARDSLMFFLLYSNLLLAKAVCGEEVVGEEGRDSDAYAYT